MKRSVIAKIIAVVVIGLVVSSVVLGLFIATYQNEIIKTLKKSEKNYITKKLVASVKNQIAGETKYLKNLSDMMKGMLANAVSNADTDSIKETLRYILGSDNIKAIKIYDTDANETFLIAFTKDGKAVFSESTSPSFSHYKVLKTDLVLDGRKIGYFKLYYDNSSAIKKISQTHKQELQQYEKLMNSISNQIKQKQIWEAIIIVISGLIVVFIIIILLNKIIKKPLKKLQIGLSSYFSYLKDPTKKVEKIDIDTKDEFGQMSKSVNESIKISIDMHYDMSQLILTLDRYVLMSETDNDGIITYASEAFCKMSGFSKEELIGKTHSIMRHPDMPDAVFKDMWETIKADKVWEGEVKNLKKDGSFYWAYSIILPKYTSLGKKYGYTAIRYDITDKKAFEELNQTLEMKIKERTKALENAKKQIEATHKLTRDSIEYASLIQGALVSKGKDLKPYFKDSFAYWMPKDTVGGDIWLFNELRHKDECLLMVIDCTGHGVPGAFVTMIIKAIEREIVSKLKKHPEFDISPAIILGYFNKTMKTLLKQEDDENIANAGFDGGIIYYNRRRQVLKFAGAYTSLFYVTNDGELKTIKGDRYSAGYKKCDINHHYKESVVEVQEGMKFYCTTDGYLDQNGGEKGFPFGQRRFKKVIEDSHDKPMSQQKYIFVEELIKWQDAIVSNDRNDDITVVGFEIGAKSDFVELLKEEIVRYDGVITQNVIAAALDAIGASVDSMSLVGTLSTIMIEACQNIMNYSKNSEAGSRQIVPVGRVEVNRINNEYYEIVAKNIVSIEDKNKIVPKIKEIQSMDKAGIKKRYRELRKSGENTHSKGGGIGMYEIAKVSDSIEYRFKAINEDKYEFVLKSIVKPKRARKSKDES